MIFWLSARALSFEGIVDVVGEEPLSLWRVSFLLSKDENYLRKGSYTCYERLEVLKPAWR